MTLALLTFLFPLSYSPGPRNMVSAANGARVVFWATVPANIGYYIATWLVTLAVGAARAARFWDGVVLLLLNPKAYVLMGLIYAQIGQPETLFWVASVFTANNLVAFCLFSLVGELMTKRFATG